jgi:hypothetical protein
LNDQQSLQYAVTLLAMAINLSRDFVEILPEARATISSSELLEILISRVLEMFNITHGAIFLCDDNRQSQFVSVGNVVVHHVKVEGYRVLKVN